MKKGATLVIILVIILTILFFTFKPSNQSQDNSQTTLTLSSPAFNNGDPIPVKAPITQFKEVLAIGFSYKF